jgi:hypothetical protein
MDIQPEGWTFSGNLHPHVKSDNISFDNISLSQSIVRCEGNIVIIRVNAYDNYSDNEQIGQALVRFDAVKKKILSFDIRGQVPEERIKNLILDFPKRM